MENNHNKIDRELAKRAKKIDDLKAQSADIQRQIRDEEIAYEAQKDLVKLLNRPAPVVRVSQLRSGTELDKIRQMLLANSSPMHIGEIAKALGKEDTKAVRASLAGSLGGYARKGQIFSKPKPNTFGLIEKSYAEGGDDLV